MDEMNRSRFTPDEEWHPETLADGRLGPPGRKPPTAVGTATPRPPRKPDRPGRYRRLTTLQRITHAMLSVLLIGSGALTTSVFVSAVGVATGMALGSLGAVVAIRLLRRSRGLRVEAHTQRRSPGDSPEGRARSA